MQRTAAGPAPRWAEIPPPPGMPPGQHRAFRAGRLTLIVSREAIGPAGALAWHLSIAHPDRYPTWDEIADARYRFVPDDVMIGFLLPPRGEYVNAHRNCFHLHEIAVVGGRLAVGPA